MKEQIKALLNDMISGEDMMDYIEDDYMILIQDLIEKLNLNYSVNVEEISDGKYKIILNKNREIKEIKMVAWISKEEFINDIINLFN